MCSTESSMLMKPEHTMAQDCALRDPRTPPNQSINDLRSTAPRYSIEILALLGIYMPGCVYA